MKTKEKKTNIFVILLLIILVIGLMIGAVFLGKYLAELHLEKNGKTLEKPNTNVTVPLKTE